MIFIGDIACPDLFTFVTDDVKNIFNSMPIIANLEGPIVEKSKVYQKKHLLFNSSKIINDLQKLNIQLLNLANNHIMDLGEEGLIDTHFFLNKHGFKSIGSGSSIQEASKSIKIIEGDQKFIFLSFGWEVIQCELATHKSAGVNPLKTHKVLNSIEDVRKHNPDCYLVVLFHWNYELELFPQPRERELARLCINEGADAIIGCHSHLVQGIEIYKDAPIVYGLGNWFIPHNFFFDGKLRFPPETNRQLAFEWSPGEEPICHWFEYNPDGHQIIYKESENFSKSDKIDELTPFRNLNHQEYVKWFKENRKQKKLLPIYKSTNYRLRNYLKDKWVMLRGNLIDFMLKLGLKEIRPNLK